MKVLAALSLLAVARSQTNLDIVCRNIVNGVDCRGFPTRPVCASTGVTFDTECEFTKAHCLDPNLKVVSDGPCSAGMTTVSGGVNTGMTNVGTKSTMGGTAAVTTATGTTMTATIPPDVTPSQPMNTQPGMTEVVTVATTTDPYLTDLCNQIVNTPCQDFDNPLCASNGQTFPNYCSFSKARCYLPGLQLAYSGTCSSTDTFVPVTTPVRTTPPPSIFDIICRTLEQVTCQDDGVQVCASNMNTYPTACDFEKAKCQDPTLSVRDC